MSDNETPRAVLDNPHLVMAAVMLNRDVDPEEIWNRLGLSLEVAMTISNEGAAALGVDQQKAFTLVELGALLAETGMSDRV